MADDDHDFFDDDEEEEYDDEEEEYEDEDEEDDFPSAKPKNRRAGMEVALLGIALGVILLSGYFVSYKNYTMYGYNLFGLFPESSQLSPSLEGKIEMVRIEERTPVDGGTVEELGFALDQGLVQGVRQGELWRTSGGATLLIQEVDREISFGTVLRDAQGELPKLRIGDEAKKMSDTEQELLTYLGMNEE